MIIKYQQFAKTNTFSLSFHILFSPFLHTFPETHRNQDLGIDKNGKKWSGTPLPPKFELVYVLCTWFDFITKINIIKV